jgi:gamma-glutamylcyclotransferase (GGCT)/AIG2-like uncharacterized protein YtfP
LFNQEGRKMVLDQTIKFIDSDTFKKGSHILICGGEIFDNPKDINILYDFFTQIIDRMNNGIIDLLYLNTNLIYENIAPLFNVLDMIRDNNLFERLKFTTSYDLVGRFRDKPMPITHHLPEEVMLDNLVSIKKEYPDIHIVTNTILTKPVCQKIINGEYNIRDWMEKYQCYVNLIPYIVLDKDLMATRNEIFKALNIVEKQANGYVRRWIDNLDLKQEKWLYIYKNNEWQFVSCEWDEKCGHSVNFKRYSEAGHCFVCDLKELFDGTL